MKRLILTLAAAIAVVASAPASVAVAKDKQGGWEQRGGGNRGWRGDDRGGPERRIQNRAAPDRRGEGRRTERRRDDGPRWERPNTEAQRAPGNGGYGVRRGGYMPPNVGAPVEDHNRFRLRTPPRGYSWVRVPGGYALVSEQTGQIFDMVPTR